MALYHRDVILTTDSGVDGRRFRGGQVMSVDASNVEIKLHIEQHLIDTRTVARAMAPRVIAGDPVVCEVTGESPALTVIAVFDAAFANAGSSNDITLGFSPGAVPRPLHGQAPRLHWRSGRAHERAWQG